jgi:hypothetical protein
VSPADSAVRSPRLGDHRAEADQVEPARVDLDAVPGRRGADQPGPAAGVAVERLAQPRDVGVQRPAGAAGRVAAPEAVGELFDGHGPVRAEQQGGEERPLFPRRDGHPPCAGADLERTEDAEI